MRSRISAPTRRLSPSARKHLVIQKIDLLAPGEEEELRALPDAPLLVSAHRRVGLSQVIDQVGRIAR